MVVVLHRSCRLSTAVLLDVLDELVCALAPHQFIVGPFAFTLVLNAELLARRHVEFHEVLVVVLNAAGRDGHRLSHEQLVSVHAALFLALSSFLVANLELVDASDVPVHICQNHGTLAALAGLWSRTPADNTARAPLSVLASGLW